MGTPGICLGVTNNEYIATVLVQLLSTSCSLLFESRGTKMWRSVVKPYAAIVTLAARHVENVAHS